MRRIIDRVRVCIVLHNMLIGSSYPAEWAEPDGEDLDNDVLSADDFDDEVEPVDEQSNVNDRRQVLLNYLIN